MKHISLIPALICLLLGQTAHAQNVAGVAVIDGKRVELLDDQTWRYADTGANPSDACRTLNPVVDFCGLLDWTPTNVPSPDFLAAYRLNDRSYGGLIFEALGTEAGVTSELLRKIVISFAANAAGIPESQLPILEVRESEVDGQTTETMTYTFKINNLPVVYQNTFFISRNATIQFIVWTIGEGYSDAEKAVAEEFLSHIRLRPEAQ